MNRNFTRNESIDITMATYQVAGVLMTHYSAIRAALALGFLTVSYVILTSIFIDLADKCPTTMHLVSTFFAILFYAAGLWFDYIFLKKTRQAQKIMDSIEKLKATDFDSTQLFYWEEEQKIRCIEVGFFKGATKVENIIYLVLGIPHLLTFLIVLCKVIR